jgi:hypothetical protein
MPLQPPLRFPAVRPGDPIVVSATLYTTFLQCPEQAAGRLRGEFGPETRRSFVGGLAHRIFARHLTGGPIEEMSAACREEIGSGMNVKLRALGLRPSELSRVVEEVGALYERFCRLGTDGFVGAEVSLEAEPAADVTLRGRIDAVFDDDGGVRLVDWKTGSLGDPGAQLDYYALLWALDRGDIPGRLEAVSVATGERHEAVPGRSDLDATAGAVAGVIDRLRASWGGDALERRAGPWCSWCPLLESCAEGRAAADLLP